MKIYVASSWRNNIQPQVVEALRKENHKVYDFKNPRPGDHGFHWSEIDPDWQQWDSAKFKEALNHPIAENGFNSDMKALQECDICVLVLASGRSAHLEAGYAIGAGKPTIIYLQDGEPELMYKMTPFICLSIEEVVKCANSFFKIKPKDILTNNFDQELKGFKVPMVVIYERPIDYPEHYVARLWDTDKPSCIIMVSPTYEELRNKMPKGMINIKRSQIDDERIYETWI